MMYETIRLLRPDEVPQARQEAREKFLSRCIADYGEVPFNDRYLDKSWPRDDAPRGIQDAMPTLWRDSQ